MNGVFRKSNRLVVFIFPIMSVLFLGTAYAGCSFWNVSGVRNLIQGNGIDVVINLTQENTSFYGTAGWVNVVSNEGETYAEQKNGGVTGVIQGSNFNAEITWGNSNSVGVYTGHISENGDVQGTTFDKSHPATKVAWHSDKPFTCMMKPIMIPPQKTLNKHVATTGVAQVNQKSIIDAKTKSVGSIAPVSTTCISGYVWRVARPEDLVCVTPESRSLAADENRGAPSRWVANGPYGPNTCVSGYVWRNAFDGDVVCVTPERRSQVEEENRLAVSHRMSN